MLVKADGEHGLGAAALEAVDVDRRDEWLVCERRVLDDVRGEQRCQSQRIRAGKRGLHARVGRENGHAARTRHLKREDSHMLRDVGTVIVHHAERRDGALRDGGDARTYGPLARDGVCGHAGIGGTKRGTHVVRLDLLQRHLREHLADDLRIALVNGGA